MRLSKRLLAELSKLLGGGQITLVDVGASRGIDRCWQSVDPLLQVVGFEPNNEEFRKLQKTSRHRWINAAVSGKREQRTLFLTKRYNNSSLLKPNLPFIQRLEWGESLDGFDVVSEIQLDCIALDDVLLDTHADFLKIDTQGTELEILHGATRLLNEELVSVRVEVMFSQLYESQSLFAAIDTKLRENGFYLHELGDVLYVKPRGLAGVGGPKGRIIQADALYFKELGNLSRLSDSKVAAAIIAYVVHGYPDAAIELLEQLQKSDRTFPSALISGLREIKHASYHFRWLPGLSFVARCAKWAWLKLRPVTHSLWENQLGNRLE